MYNDIVFIRAVLYPRSSVSVTARKPERCFEKGNSGVSVQESKRVFSAYSTHERKRTAARGISFNAYGVPGSRLKCDLKQFHAILSQFLKRHRNRVSLRQNLIERDLAKNEDGESICDNLKEIKKNVNKINNLILLKKRKK